VVIADLPDPGLTASTKLYSQEFYGLARRALAAGGRLVVHAGPVSPRPRFFWTVEATIRAAGLSTAPYRVDARLPGTAPGSDRPAAAGTRAPCDWGFVLAARTRPPLLGTSLRADARAADRTRTPDLPPSTLVHPRYRD
jgi:spermidine synthase